MQDNKHKKNKEEKKQENHEDYKAKYLRVLADYQNFERRVGQRENELTDRSKRDLIVKLLPFLDNLEKAEMFVQDPGMKLVKQQFLQTLQNEGLEEIVVEGKEYDPHLAEAVEAVAGDEDNKVIEVLRKGYSLKGMIIRPAQVKVSKKS